MAELVIERSRTSTDLEEWMYMIVDNNHWEGYNIDCAWVPALASALPATVAKRVVPCWRQRHTRKGSWLHGAVSAST